MRGVYAGEVHNVAAGYARNYLLPKKMAVYATPRNFERCGLVDPDIAAKEEEGKMQQLGDEENEDLKAADRLRIYLRNKSVKIIRNADPNMPTMCHPGHVSAKNLCHKLSKQLRIDLEEHETIHIRNEPIVGMDELDEAQLMALLGELDEDQNVAAKAEASEEVEATVGEEGEGDATSIEAAGDGGEAAVDEVLTATDQGIGSSELEQGALKDCDTQVKQLGDYVAKITLAGGYVVPLKFRVERR